MALVMPAKKSKKCPLCKGDGIVTVMRPVRGKRPDTTNEAICMTCLGTGTSPEQ